MTAFNDDDIHTLAPLLWPRESGPIVRASLRGIIEDWNEHLVRLRILVVADACRRSEQGTP